MAALGALTASLLAACSPAPADDGDAGGTDTLTVLAAASLTDPFTALARRYERDHPGVTVRLSFGSSTKLAQQVAEGAPADLVALAGPAVLAQLPEEARDPGRRTLVARNTLEIATPPDDPAGVTGLADLLPDWILPPEGKQHVRNARKEMMMAARSMLDAAIAHQDAAPAPRRTVNRVEID